jgi:hypothetical protein
MHPIIQCVSIACLVRENQPRAFGPREPIALLACLSCTSGGGARASKTLDCVFMPIATLFDRSIDLRGNCAIGTQVLWRMANSNSNPQALVMHSKRRFCAVTHRVGLAKRTRVRSLQLRAYNFVSCLIDVLIVRCVG